MLNSLILQKSPTVGSILSKWLRKSRRPKENLRSTVWFLGLIFKYNIKHFISCKQKCKICSHKNILFLTLHNSKWSCKYFLSWDIDKCINWQMCLKIGHYDFLKKCYI